MDFDQSKEEIGEPKPDFDQVKKSFWYSQTPKPLFDFMAKGQLRPVEFALLSSILEFCFKKQLSLNSFPLGATEAGNLLGIGRASAQRVVVALVEKGFLVRSRGPKGHSNTYSLNVNPPQNEASTTRLKMRLPLASKQGGYPPQNEAPSYLLMNNEIIPPLPPAGARGGELTAAFKRLAVEGFDANDCVMVFESVKDLGQIKDFYAYAVHNLRNPVRLAGIREQVTAKRDAENREREKYQNLKIVTSDPGPDLTPEQRESFLKQFPGFAQFMEPTE